MAVFETFQDVEPLRMTRVKTFLLEFDESWVTLSDQCRNHHFEVLNQSISVSEYFQIRSFCNDFMATFFDIKTLLKDHTGADVSLAKFQSRANVG